MQYHTHKNCNDLNLNLGPMSIVLPKIYKYYRTHKVRVDLISCTLVHSVCVCSYGLYVPVVPVVPVVLPTLCLVSGVLDHVQIIHYQTGHLGSTIPDLQPRAVITCVKVEHVESQLESEPWMNLDEPDAR